MPKTIKIVAIALSIFILLTLSFGAGCALNSRVAPDSDYGLDLIEQAWNIIFRDYVGRDKLDATTLSQAAIKGMIEALDDPYTAYLDIDIYQLSLSSLEGKFEGIGAQVAVEDGQLMIIAPIDDSPAAEAGIKAGDTILEISGHPASEMSLTEAVLNIRGPAGTPITLLILHLDETEPEEIEIVRAEIELVSVQWEMMENIAYIRITHFSERTGAELPPALQSIVQEAPDGIILDLRSNPGGSLQAVVEVTSQFLSAGIVVSIADNQGRQTSLEVEPDGLATDLPMVVLVDKFSASGSEVLAGALQDHGRATIAGTKTFGKGSVNIIRQLKDGSGLAITTARWLTPNGTLIEGEGLSPDYELELEGDDAIQWAIDYLESHK